MFITPEIVSEIPNANTGVTMKKHTDETAAQFYRTLVMADKQWVKFYAIEATSQDVDKFRRVPRHFIHCSAMKRYFDQIEYVTRYTNGVLNGYARIK